MDAGRLSGKLNHVASFVRSDWVRSRSTHASKENSLIVNDASFKKCSAQAGLPGSVKQCAERPWLLRMLQLHSLSLELFFSFQFTSDYFFFSFIFQLHFFSRPPIQVVVSNAEALTTIS